MVRRVDRVQIKSRKRRKAPSSIAITTGNEVIAKTLRKAFRARDIDAQLVANLEDVQADMIVLTEGMQTGQDPLTRHWTILKSCNTLRQAGVSVTILGRYGNDDFASLSGLQGLSRTLRQEWPETAISTLEISGDFDSDEITKALLSSHPEGQLRAGKVAAISVTDAPLSLPSPSLKPVPGNWLITGGGRGVTAACAIELARHVRSGTFFLAGRSDVLEWPEYLADYDRLPDLRAALIRHAQQRGDRPRPASIDKHARALLAGREVRGTLEALNQVGADAHYLKLDISDRANVKSTLSRLLKAHGPITGLVHGAGVLADRNADKKTKDDVTRVFAPKVEGLLNLFDVLDLQALNYCGFFSSAAAVFGNPGQSDYAMANAWLNAVAERLHATQDQMQVKSFCWGPWAGGMVDDTLAAHFEDRGIDLIGLQDGAEIFAHHLLYGDRDAVNLLIGDRWQS